MFILLLGDYTLSLLTNILLKLSVLLVLTELMVYVALFGLNNCISETFQKFDTLQGYYSSLLVTVLFRICLFLLTIFALQIRWCIERGLALIFFNPKGGIWSFSEMKVSKLSMLIISKRAISFLFLTGSYDESPLTPLHMSFFMRVEVLGLL